MSCQLYRHFDATGALLYVGISMSAVNRLSQHRYSPWFKEIARVEIERCSTREYAGFLEAFVIKTEKPKYNVVQPTYDPCSPTLMYTLIQEARSEAWVDAWHGKDVSETLQICDEEEADILPQWYRRQKSK